MPKNDGGPAFPGEYAITMRHPEGGDETRMISGSGMTLRDWYAGQALMGWRPAMHLSHGPTIN